MITIDEQTREQRKKKKKKIVINLIDFGFCEIARNDFVVQQGMIKGTAGYIAPEIFTEFRYSKKSDLYAIGCIGFEMITGGRLPNEYDARGEYIGCDDDSDDEDEDGANSCNSLSMNDDEKREDEDTKNGNNGGR